MKKKTFTLAICSLSAFTAWTALVRLIDVASVGPVGSNVGFASFNTFVHSITGVNMVMYTVTDWLGLLPFIFAAGFAFLGLAQWIRRGRINKVDRSILLLGVFYAVVIAVYILFEVFPVNYRPILIDGKLEASYPSSTTTLVMCVMPTALMELNSRICVVGLRICASLFISAFIVFMVAGRLISGVHWASDIIGGIFLSTGLVMLYRAVRDK